MTKSKLARQYLLCVRNDKYPASLEMRKIYQALPDRNAAAKSFVRVIDESGEDYLYLANYFVAIDVPQAARRDFAEAS